MGQIRAKLSTEISIGQVVRDLQRESGDSESHVLRLLAEVVENSELGKRYRIYVYAKRRESIKSRRADIGQDVDATIQRKLTIAPPSLALRLREAARDGWSPRTRRMQIDGEPAAIADLIIEKPSLITALEAEGISIPKNWTGGESPDDKDARIAEHAAHLKASGERRFLEIIAKEEGVTTSAIKQRIARAKAKKV